MRARLILSGILIMLLATAARAQEGSFGIGGLVGATSGLTFRIVPEEFIGLLPRTVRAEALDVVAAWTLDGYVFTQIHFTRDSDIPASPLSFFVGPGIVTEFDDRQGRIGISALGGVRFFRARFEVFLHVAPYLLVFPDTHGRFTPGVGVRFYP